MAKMFCLSGRIAICSFVCTIIPYSILFLPREHYNSLTQISGGVIFGPILYFICINIILKCLCYGYIYEVAVRAVFLGCVFMTGVFIEVYGEGGLQVFGIYMCTMAIFHYTEFVSIAIIQPGLVSTDSYVINHSKEYTIAAVTSWIEYFVEYYFFPGFKSIYWITNFGLIACMGGEILRKCAMFTAKSNFNHIVQCEKTKDHVLVTHGVYSLCRHPSYVGWFYWSIGTQLILVNPLCTVAYGYVSWRFFRERVNIEELTLLNFFGKQYYDYQQLVSTGLPMIEGYKIKP